jgi:D-alanyl-D-alanine-carboxypeptidase/D-alanyl-D-alanine-endopeptidase
MQRLLTIVLLAVALSRASVSFAAEIVPKAEIDSLVQPAIDGDWCRGVVIGIVNAGGSQVVGYGTAVDSAPAAPDGGTVFEIGSVSKVFTGTLLADAIERGEVALDDPAQKYLPDSVKMPQRNGKQITLHNLATQHSGLPRLPGNIHWRDPSDPYIDYTVPQMYDFLSSHTLRRDPGAEYEYSNLGVGLLGHVLALHAGKSYEELLRERIAGPLGMKSTRIVLDDATRSRLAQGHNADGDPVPNWSIVTLAGAGGIRSTVNDLLIFLSANLGFVKSPLGPAFERAIRPLDTADWANDIGMCWHIDKTRRMPWHNGQTGGYHSFITFDPVHRFGIVVLSNCSAPIADRIGIALGRKLLGGQMEQLSLPSTIAVDPKTADALCGVYMISPLIYMTIANADGRLTCQLTGQPQVRIYSQTETDFFFKAADARLKFRKGRSGQITGLRLRQNGKETSALKIPAEKAGTTQPTTRE